MADENEDLDRGDALDVTTDTDVVETKDPETGKVTGDKLGDDAPETDEEKAEREAEEAEEAKKRRARIPLNRHEEILKKARDREQALSDEVSRLKGAKQDDAAKNSVTEYQAKIDDLQDKYEELILDGKKDEARAVRKEVEGMREVLFDHKSSVKAEATRAATIETLSWQAALAGAESKYPVLNPEHDDFDAAKTDEVTELMTGFVRNGQTRAEALNKALKYVLGAPPTAPKSDVASKLADERAQAARVKAAAANKQQPASTSKVGLDSDKGGKGGEQGIDVMRLSQDKFAKLEEDTLAKMRGDEVE